MARNLFHEMFLPRLVAKDEGIEFSGVFPPEEELIMHRYCLYPSQLPWRSLAHYVDRYRKDRLDPKLAKFSSWQRAGFAKLSRKGAPEKDSPEYAKILQEHGLADPMPSQKFARDYMDDYRKHGQDGKLFSRLSLLQQEGIIQLIAFHKKMKKGGVTETRTETTHRTVAALAAE